MNMESESDDPQSVVRNVISRGQEQFAKLTVLVVRLLFRNEGTIVRLRLAVGHEGQGPAEQLDWDVPIAAFESGVGGDTALAFPSTLDDDVRFRLDSLGSPAPGMPLWLKLARPYGRLGGLPWERELGRGLGRPVLRLPDYPDRPVERPGVLENVVVVDPGRDAEPAAVTHRVRVLVEAILRGSARAVTRVHLFADARWFPCLQSLAVDQRVTLYDPQHAMTSSELAAQGRAAAGSTPRAAPWSDWIAASMSSRGVDAVHLMCRARNSSAGAEFVLSCSPSPDETSCAQVVVEPTELAVLLNRAGAWALSFVPAATGKSDALATFADSFAHQRPGAVLFHALAEPDDEASLRGACEFLFARRPSHAPFLSNGFLYCHPSFVVGSGASPGEQSASTLRPVAEAQADTAPNWVGATQRFVESTMLEQVRKLGPDLLLSSTPSGDVDPRAASSSATAVNTLVQIQNVVADYLKTHGKG